jgi:hypothetical protein
MRAVFREYGLSIVLGVFFIASWLVQSVAGWVEFASEQQQLGAAATLLGSDGYIFPWLQSTFENWQSEFLQLFAFVVLTTFLIHRHSHESRDGQDKMQKNIEAILAKVEALESKRS